MAVHVFGIRHHGPGSARSLHAALRRLAPDLVLVEGPVEADEQIRWLGDPALRPPVALLVFRPDEPRSSVFYPFARFSPEWIALRYAVENNVPAHFMDLPKTNWMAVDEAEDDERPKEDPLDTIAKLAGDQDFERWWDRFVESRGEADVFDAVHEAMGALRADGYNARKIDLLREAAMRQQIRQAQKQSTFERIAVVCGAMHAPALTGTITAKDDTALLKGLPKVKVQVTWVPWTQSRLLAISGYGAGVESPGWYDHLWTTPDKPIEHWISKVAQLLREEDLDASPAQVVDAVRLAETLASFRGRRQPGLQELNDATEAALLFGNSAPLRLISAKLIVGESMGEVPTEATAVPIQKDLEALQKRLRLKADPLPKSLDLDLRKEGDRERSELLHRLNILNIAWGELGHAHGKMGTFHEVWRLAWEPEFAIDLITAAPWGNTIEAAASAHARNRAAQAQALSELTGLLEPVLKARLPDAAPTLMSRLREIAALAPDIAELMAAISPLARVARYGDVRQTDRTMVQQALEELSARICVGLPVACGSLNDDAARGMIDRMEAMHQAVALLDDPVIQGPWREAIRKVAELPQVHTLVAGRCCRLLYDAGEMTAEEISNRASQSLSPGTEPAAGAGWIEGFLEKSGSILLLNNALWNLIDNWISALPEETFRNTLPLVRRTFSTFASSERRQLGERVRDVLGSTTARVSATKDIDTERAAQSLPLLAKLLGLKEGASE